MSEWTSSKWVARSRAEGEIGAAPGAVTGPEIAEVLGRPFSDPHVAFRRPVKVFRLRTVVSCRPYRHTTDQATSRLRASDRSRSDQHVCGRRDVARVRVARLGRREDP